MFELIDGVQRRHHLPSWHGKRCSDGADRDDGIRKDGGASGKFLERSIRQDHQIGSFFRFEFRGDHTGIAELAFH